MKGGQRHSRHIRGQRVLLKILWLAAMLAALLAYPPLARRATVVRAQTTRDAYREAF